MSIDDGFDFFWMHFLAADVDDPATPAHEEIAVASQFNEVACVHVSVVIGKLVRGSQIAIGSARRLEAQRAVRDLDPDGEPT